jgi:hypothetical protein
VDLSPALLTVLLGEFGLELGEHVGWVSRAKYSACARSERSRSIIRRRGGIAVCRCTGIGVSFWVLGGLVTVSVVRGIRPPDAKALGVPC